MGTPNDTFAAEVESVVDQLAPNADGKLELPEGVEASSQALYAAKIEIRRRDTYASYGKEKNANKALQAENAALAAQWEEDASSMMTAKERTELSTLKASDPDAWLAKVEELKGTNANKFKEKRAAVSKKANEMTEVELRTSQIELYNEENPEYVINDDVIADDIPPKYTKQLSSGKITFEQFISKASKFLKANKVLDKGASKEDEPNMSNSGGSSSPSKQAIVANASETYKKTVF